MRTGTIARTCAALALTFVLSAAAAEAQTPVSSSGQGHGHGQSHATHGTPQEKPHRKPGGEKEYPPGIPPITDEDRRAAFPELNGQHTVHDERIHSYTLFDQLEWQTGHGGGVSWDTKGWIGGDVSRFWFRTEGESADGRLDAGEFHALYGRAIHRWWDVVAGVRQDVRPGPAQTWAAVGIQGLAPYWFEVEATAYVGASGRTQFRLETEYELLLTNRLVLQPLVELDAVGKRDPERGVGAGLSSMETGLRLRYEIRREFAPYVGVTWHRKFFGTADLAKAAGEEASGARLALGARIWF